MRILNLPEQIILAWYKTLKPDAQRQVDSLINEERRDDVLTLFRQDVSDSLDTANRVVAPEK